MKGRVWELEVEMSSVLSGKYRLEKQLAKLKKAVASEDLGGEERYTPFDMQCHCPECEKLIRFRINTSGSRWQILESSGKHEAQTKYKKELKEK